MTLSTQCAICSGLANLVLIIELFGERSWSSITDSLSDFDSPWPALDSPDYSTIEPGSVFSTFIVRKPYGDTSGGFTRSELPNMIKSSPLCSASLSAWLMSMRPLCIFAHAALNAVNLFLMTSSSAILSLSLYRSFFPTNCLSVIFACVLGVGVFDSRLEKFE